MKIIKKFDQYLKNSKMNESHDEESDDDLYVDPDMDLEDRDEDPELEDGFGDDFSGTEDMDGDNGGDEDTEDREYEEEESQEEGEEYEGTKLMKELADRIGAEVSDNNEIDFDGKKINFFSETDKFHIGGNQFDSVDDVVSYLSGEGTESED